MITSISSARAHNARGAVHWDIFRNITPGILLGTFVGGLVATHMPTLFLKIFFICFLFVVSAQMLSNYRPPASRNMPGFLGTQRRGRNYRAHFQFRGHRRRHAFRAFHEFLQRAPA